jgi:hypothetical protein
MVKNPSCDRILAAKYVLKKHPAAMPTKNATKSRVSLRPDPLLSVIDYPQLNHQTRRKRICLHLALPPNMFCKTPAFGVN